MKKSSDAGLVKVLMQINAGVAAGGRSGDKRDVVMDFVIGGLGVGRKPCKPGGVGGRVGLKPGKKGPSPISRALSKKEGGI